MQVSFPTVRRTLALVFLGAVFADAFLELSQPLDATRTLVAFAAAIAGLIMAAGYLRRNRPR